MLRKDVKMERIKELNRYQKGILLLLIGMMVIFSVIYSVYSSHSGYLYKNEFLQRSVENGNTRYCGTIDGQECCFTVTSDKAVTFQYGNKTYGPYTAKEDPTAIPNGKEYMTGVEILDGNEVFFRGGVHGTGNERILYDENENILFDAMVIINGGVAMDGNGNIIDQMEPSPFTVLELMSGPELVNKAEWAAYLGGVFLSILTAVYILFADALFRLHLVFRVDNVEAVEPSDWEITRRHIGWTVMTITAFVIYMIGLR